MSERTRGLQSSSLTLPLYQPLFLMVFSGIGTNNDPQERNGNYLQEDAHFTHLSQHR